MKNRKEQRSGENERKWGGVGGKGRRGANCLSSILQCLFIFSLSSWCWNAMLEDAESL